MPVRKRPEDASENAPGAASEQAPRRGQCENAPEMPVRKRPGDASEKKRPGDAKPPSPGRREDSALATTRRLDRQAQPGARPTEVRLGAIPRAGAFQPPPPGAASRRGSARSGLESPCRHGP